MNGFAIALAGLLISTSYLVSQSNKSNDSPHSPQQNSDRAKPNAPSASPTQASTEAPNKPSTNPPAKEKPERDWFDYVTLALTAVLAVTAIFGTCYAVQTLRAIQHEARIAVGALKESGKLARAAKTSADALTDAANFAKTTTKDSERADILMDAASIVLSPSGVLDGDARLVLRYKNFGRTRAKDVHFRAEMIIEGVTLKSAQTEQPVMTMGAGQEQTIGFQTFRECLTQVTFTQIVQGKIKLLFVASVVYDDVFGSSYTTRDAGIFDYRTFRFRIEDKMAG